MSVLETIKLNRTNKKKSTPISIFGADLLVNKIDFGHTMELSKKLSANDIHETEQAEALISEMVSDTNGNYIFQTPEGIEELRAQDLEEVKILIDLCAKVAGFDLSEKVETAVKN